MYRRCHSPSEPGNGTGAAVSAVTLPQLTPEGLVVNSRAAQRFVDWAEQDELIQFCRRAMALIPRVSPLEALRLRAEPQTPLEPEAEFDACERTERLRRLP